MMTNINEKFDNFKCERRYALTQTFYLLLVGVDTVMTILENTLSFLVR